MDEWHFIAQRKIEEAMREGVFDNLSGKGEPIDLEEDPFVDPSLRMAHRLLRNNGFVPAWVEEAKEIDDAVRRLRSRRIEPEAFAREAAEINRRIANFNLRMPANLHKQPIRA